jgi:predicted RNA-binding protein with RPS1 domain
MTRTWPRRQPARWTCRISTAPCFRPTPCRRRSRSLSRAHRKRPWRSRPVAREGPPRGKLDQARKELQRQRARRRRHLQPRQGRLHRRSRRRRGLPAGLPGRHPPGARRVGPLMHIPQPFEILKMDKRRGNIVVSRRTVLEESRAEQRSEIVPNLEEGQTCRRRGQEHHRLRCVRRPWRHRRPAARHRHGLARVNHPSEILSIGQTVKVQIIKHQPGNPAHLARHEAARKPIRGKASKRYPVGKPASRALSPTSPTTVRSWSWSRVEGLIHVSEMSWTKKNVHPGKILSTSQEVEVEVLEVDPRSAASRSASSRPWTIRGKSFAESIRPAPKSKAKSRTSPSSVCSSASKAMSTAWSTSPTSTGTVRAKQAIEDYNKGDMVKASCSTSTSTRSASRWASSSLAAIRWNRSSSRFRRSARAPS